MKLTSTYFLLAGAVFLLTSSASTTAAAQAWPTKPVRLVVGFSAGGPTDVVARAFAEYASRSLGQAFLVENKPGANSIIAAETVAAAPPDGYTLLMAATNHTMIPALYAGRVKFDAVRSFSPVCVLAASPTVLVTGPSMPVKTFANFLLAVKEAPGKRTYGTAGVGSSGHFASEQFLQMARLSMNHVPYKGAAQVVTDLMGGQLDSSFATLGSVVSQVQSGKLNAIAVAAPKRSVLLPTVPTFSEAGIKGYSADAWYGVLAPVGTPSAIVSTLTQVATQFLEQNTTVAKLHSLGLEVQSSCRDEFAATLDRDTKAYSKLAKDLNLKLD